MRTFIAILLLSLSACNREPLPYEPDKKADMGEEGDKADDCGGEGLPCCDGGCEVGLTCYQEAVITKTICLQP